MRYRLRTLLTVVTLVAICFGYEVDWIHRRRVFLSAKEAAWADHQSESHKGEAVRWWRFQLHDSGNCIAPQLLWLFGERGVNTILIAVPDKDVINGKTGYEMSHNQPDYRLAKRLFPEAEIEPIKWSKDIPDDQGAAWHPIKVH